MTIELNLITILIGWLIFQMLTYPIWRTFRSFRNVYDNCNFNFLGTLFCVAIVWILYLLYSIPYFFNGLLRWGRKQ